MVPNGAAMLVTNAIIANKNIMVMIATNAPFFFV